jgi:phenylalanyl-tRNA synthetase beta chain
VSVIVGDERRRQSVVEAVREGAGELLEDVRCSTCITGPQIGEGRKSLRLRCGSGAADGR